MLRISERFAVASNYASLEEMFNPDRLKETHVPGGFRPLGTDARAIPGHTFGLNLKRGFATLFSYKTSLKWALDSHTR
jgi:hypothetical protein